jgi:HSP20 family protein
MLGRRRKKVEVEEFSGGNSFTPEAEGQLTIDVYQTPDEIVVQSTVAGVDPADVEIDATSESLTIRGERSRSQTVSDSDYYYQECFWGKFSREVILPQEVDPDRAHSTLKNGVLTVHLPKIHRDRTRKISVKREG